MKYEARKMALLIHKDDKYGEFDYMYHLDNTFNMAVALFGMSFANENYDLLYLHDAVEDHPECIDYLIEKGMPEERRDILYSLSYKAYRSRKQYIECIRQAEDRIKYIKIADTATNLEQSLKIGDMIRISKYSRQMTSLLAS